MLNGLILRKRPRLRRSREIQGRSRQGLRHATRNGVAARGAAKGAARIAACWAEKRKIVQFVFKPFWSKHGKPAPFKRYDVLFETLPAGAIGFPGSGNAKNLADMARALGIPVLAVRRRGRVNAATFVESSRAMPPPPTRSFTIASSADVSLKANVTGWKYTFAILQRSRSRRDPQNFAENAGVYL